MLIHY